MEMGKKCRERSPQKVSAYRFIGEASAIALVHPRHRHATLISEGLPSWRLGASLLVSKSTTKSVREKLVFEAGLMSLVV